MMLAMIRVKNRNSGEGSYESRIVLESGNGVLFFLKIIIYILSYEYVKQYPQYQVQSNKVCGNDDFVLVTRFKHILKNWKN